MHSVSIETLVATHLQKLGRNLPRPSTTNHRDLTITPQTLNRRKSYVMPTPTAHGINPALPIIRNIPYFPYLYHQQYENLLLKQACKGRAAVRRRFRATGLAPLRLFGLLRLRAYRA